MPARERHRTKYPGVYYIEAMSATGRGSERVYYIVYRLNGRLIEEKAGRQYQDDMTPAKAALIRVNKINRTVPPNAEKRRGGTYTLNLLWDEYRAHKAANKTIKNDGMLYNRYISSNLGDIVPDKITPRQIDSLRRDHMAHLAPQSVKHVLSLIKRIINYGVSRCLCKPLSFRIEMPKFDNRRTEDLTHEQAQRLMAVLASFPDRAAATFMLIALHTGMRHGEILNLTWDDIDYERGFIAIRGPKGGVDQKIPLTDATAEIIKGISRTPSRYLFPGVNGHKRTNTGFARQFRAIRKLAGLPDTFRPMHGLRHAYASALASSGKVDMYTLQKLLTHKSPQMTQRYAHLRDEALKKAASVADEVFKLDDKYQPMVMFSDLNGSGEHR